MEEQTDGWTEGLTDGRMVGQTDGQMDGRTDVWTQSMLQEQDEYPSAKYVIFPILEKEKNKVYLVPQDWKRIYWGR